MASYVTTVEHWAKNGQRYRPHCYWSATRCSNRATTHIMCMGNWGGSQWSSWTVLSSRLRTTFTPQYQVNEIVSRAFNAAGAYAYATREPHSLCGRYDKRPDGATQIPWKSIGLGRLLLQHIRTVICASQQQEGWFSSNMETELMKLLKYQDISTGVDFIPVAIESSGVWVQHAMELVSEFGRRLSEVSHEPRSTSFLRQRLAVAFKRGNASCIIGTLQINSSMYKL